MSKITFLINMSGGDSEKVTPVPIPNTEVKLLSADGSWGLSPCESRTLPGNNENSRKTVFLFMFTRKGKPKIHLFLLKKVKTGG